MNISRMAAFTGFFAILATTLVPAGLIALGMPPEVAVAVGLLGFLLLSTLRALRAKSGNAYVFTFTMVAFFMELFGIMGNEWSGLLLVVVPGLMIVWLLCDDRARVGLGSRVALGAAVYMVIAAQPKLMSDELVPWAEWQVALLGFAVWLVALLLTGPSRPAQATQHA